MIRRCFTIVAAVSLLLCLATVALWIRSDRRGDGLNKTGPGRQIDIYSARGQIIYYTAADSPPSIDTDWRIIAFHGPGWSFQSWPHPIRSDCGDARWFNRLGIAVEWRDQVPIIGFSTHPIFSTETQLIFPHGLLALMLAVLPMLWMLGYRRRRSAWRRIQGLCPLCGYDLRASQHRCPECGAPISPKTEAKA